jgi:hypothetical protein
MQTKESHAEAKCVAQGLTEVVNDLREGCHATYNGGYHDEPAHGAFHHGMDTVCNVIGAGWLERAIAKHREFPTTTAIAAREAAERAAKALIDEFAGCLLVPDGYTHEGFYLRRWTDTIAKHCSPVSGDVIAGAPLRSKDTIMELQADVTALSYHLKRALSVIEGEIPLDVNQIAEARRALENVAE